MIVTMDGENSSHICSNKLVGYTQK